MVQDGPEVAFKNADGNYMPASAGRIVFCIAVEKGKVLVPGVEHPQQQIRLVSLESKTWLLLSCRRPQHWITMTSSVRMMGAVPMKLPQANCWLDSVARQRAWC